MWRDILKEEPELILLLALLGCPTLLGIVYMICQTVIEVHQ